MLSPSTSAPDVISTITPYTDETNDCIDGHNIHNTYIHSRL